VEVSRASALSNPSRRDMPARVDRLLSSCTLVDVSAPVLRAARRLASPSVRTLDAIHLASALRVEADELVAYDLRLLEAARDQDMRVVSPGG
jgi:predicted nucleic acid-binding protein